ncbi:hypothetical protein KAI04_01720 [Candidatus Pacearchaeota archaeon]|nr:hypothetical protein [Candidatus Pacearchaeota archaeon]
MNKRGNLPIIILVLGVLAVCSLALLSFYSSNLKVSNNFESIKLVEKLNSQIETNLYQEKPVEGLREFKEVVNYNFKDGFLKEKIIFSVTYNP